MIHCMRKHTPLNGATANTEGGRIRRKIVYCEPIKAEGFISEPCQVIQRIQPVITPTESSYLTSKMEACGNFPRSGAITQEMAKAILAQAGSRQKFESEGERIQNVENNANFCATDPFSETARFSNYSRIPDPFICPPLPPPPAPPAKQCPLQKNQKF
jgi:hypothetical protein